MQNLDSKLRNTSEQYKHKLKPQENCKSKTRLLENFDLFCTFSLTDLTTVHLYWHFNLTMLICLVFVAVW